MAATITYRGSAKNGLTISLTEAGIGSAAEWGPIFVPKKGVIKSYRSYISALGASVTHDPEIGRASGWAPGDLNEIAAQYVGGPSRSVGAGDLNVHYNSPAGALYIRPGLDNATANSTVEAELEIEGR